MKHARIFLVVTTLALFIGLVLYRNSRVQLRSPFVQLHSLHRASSGTFIESNLILSCAHGKVPNQHLSVVLADGRRLKGKVVWLSPSKDLSLVESDHVTLVSPMTIADRGQPWSDAVQLYGFGGTGRLHEYQAIVLKRGHVSHTWGDGSPNPNWNSYLKLSGFSQRGDSGGAAVAADRIVGVIVGTSHSTASDGSRAYYTDCVPVDVIWDFVDEWHAHLQSASRSRSK